MHGKAKEQAEIDGEKELIETSTVQAMGKNKYGNITTEELQNELQGEATVEKIRKKIVVTINDSQRSYYVDDDGNVFEYEYFDLAIMENGSDFYNRMSDYRESILTVSVLDNMNVPENAYRVFDVSKEQNETVKAWLVENAENTDMYDLYIGSNEGVAIENCSCMFSELSNCIEIKLDNLYTENVKDFSKMFWSDTNLIKVNLDNLDSSNVTTMNRMFQYCGSLKTLDLSNFTTSNLTDMTNMFFKCTNLESVDLSTFDTSNVTNMGQLFNGCQSIKKLDLEHFDVSKLSGWGVGGYYMFANCNSLEELHISSWDVSNLTNMTRNVSGLQQFENFRFKWMEYWKSYSYYTDVFKM